MANIFHGASRYEKLVYECVKGRALSTPHIFPNTFGYLLEANPLTGNLDKATIVDAYDALVESMRTGEAIDGPADAGMTFFGQFIDHDITLDATSAIGTRIDPADIRNVRTPNLDPDCVYGNGPDAAPHLYSQKHNGFMLFGREDNEFDLARNCDGRALIGDPRNDENIIVSQIQGAFVGLHNILMSRSDEVREAVSQCAQMGIRKEVWDTILPKDQFGFEEVRRFIRLHYQWLVLKDFLPAFVSEDSIQLALESDPFGPLAPMMPVEFSVGAYRFGHATVQPSYRLQSDPKTIDLFDMLGFSKRKTASNIEMDQFFSNDGTAQKARPVGPKMAETLFRLPSNIVSDELDWEGFKIPIERARKLGLRNILRDRTSLEVPSGQQVARHLKIPELKAPPQLADRHITKTPLWFYCLQEAQERGGGRLTGVGGAIVASVLIRLLKLDPESVLNTHGFEPWEGFGEPFSMATLMRYVEDNRETVPNREALFCG